MMKRWLGLTLCAAGMTVASATEVLVWSDEFEGDSLDTTKWTAETGLVRNDKAAQIYRNDAEHLSVSDGALKMTATYSAEGYANPYYGKDATWTDWRCYRKSMNYASGSVNSFGKLSIRYGRIEVRGRFDVASGVWPAIWMLGSTQDIPANLDDPEIFWKTASTIQWPQCGEIDIMEYATRDDAETQAEIDAARTYVHGTFHWGDSWTGNLYKYSGQVLACAGLDETDLSDSESGWHVYGLNWTPEQLTITFDGETVHSMATADMANPGTGLQSFREHAFHFILNLALGSMANDPPSDGEGYPRTHMIDYVRVYQDPSITGNQLLINGKDHTFAGFTSNVADARAMLPEDATVQADGSLLIADAPMVIGGFDPTMKSTLTLDVTIPAEGTGTIVGLRSGANNIRFARTADGTASCWFNGESQTAGSTTCDLTPGRHTIRIAYDTARPQRNGTKVNSTTSGTRVWVDDALVYVSPTLLWAQTTVPYLTVGGDASDNLSTPMAGLVVHSATFEHGSVPNRFVCTDSTGVTIVPASATRPADGSIVIGTAPLTVDGFTGSSTLTVTMDAEVPEGTTGALIGLKIVKSGTTYTASAECVEDSIDPILYNGTTEHSDTVVYGRPSAGRHLYRLTYSTATGTQLWEDDVLLASAPKIYWSNATVTAVTFGGSAETTAARILTGLKIYTLRVDTTTAAPEYDALEELFTWPSGLNAAGFGVRQYLATIAANADGTVSVPEVTLNGKPLDTLSSARALWFYGLTEAAEVKLGVGEMNIQDDGGITFAVDADATQSKGALALIGANTLDGEWSRLKATAAPIASGDTLSLTGADAEGYTFFKLRAEEGVYNVGPAAYIQQAIASSTEGMPSAQQHSGTAPLFTFNFAGVSSDLGVDTSHELTLFLEGCGLEEGAMYTLTLGETTLSAELQVTEDGATVTFTNLPKVEDGATFVLSGPVIPGEVSLKGSSWGEVSGSTRTAAILALNLITDGFVPEDTTLAGYYYRIPALATNGKGEVVALYDVRYGGGDLGVAAGSGIDLGESYSDDFGATWGAPRLAVDVPNYLQPDGTLHEDGVITADKDIGDAAILYDPAQKQYWAMAITGGGLTVPGENTAQNDCVLYTRAEGDGAPWSEWTGGAEGSRSVKAALLAGIGKSASPGKGILQGPGHGIVTTIGREGMPTGTLVFPMQAFVNSGFTDAQCFATYSTDNGDTWQTTDLTPATLTETPHNAQENCIMELDDGSWLMMAKGGRTGAGNGRRLFFRTTNFKEWTQLDSIPKVIHVQGSCLRLGKGTDGVGRYVLAHQIDPNKRAKLALIFGRDLTATNTSADSEGVEWDTDNPVMLHVEDTMGMGYVSLTLLDSTTLGVLYETYGKIYFERIDITPWLTSP